MDEQVLHEKLLVDEGLRVQQSILRPFLVAFVQHAAQPDHSRLAHPLHRVEVELVEEQIDEYFFPEHIPVVVDGQPETSDPKLYEILESDALLPDEASAAVLLDVGAYPADEGGSLGAAGEDGQVDLGDTDNIE